MTAAPINKIIPFSAVDGDGNRSAIFLQGCGIACAYCHNPETQQLCNDCGACVAACPQQALALQAGKLHWHTTRCTGCDSCVAACPRSASPKVQWLTADEVMERLAINRPFIRGITVSGGECTLYPQFLTELLTLAKQQGLHCLLDSNGETDLAQYPQLMAVCDGVMLDVKAWDSDVYHRLTGGSNAVVKQNVSFLAQQGKLAELRLVCVPDEVDIATVIEQLALQLAGQIADIKLKLIVFRNNGVRGRLSLAAPPTPEQMTAWQQQAVVAGFSNTIVVG